jgi:hypothetical protein
MSWEKMLADRKMHRRGRGSTALAGGLIDTRTVFRSMETDLNRERIAGDASRGKGRPLEV